MKRLEVPFYNASSISVAEYPQPLWYDERIAVAIGSVVGNLQLRKEHRQTYRGDPLIDVSYGPYESGYDVPLCYLNGFLFRLRYPDYKDKRQQALIMRYQYDLSIYISDYFHKPELIPEWNLTFESWDRHWGIGPFDSEEPVPVSLNDPTGPTPTKEELHRPGGVYIVRCGDYCKIGYSAAPPERVKALSCQSPYPMEHLLTIYSYNYQHLEKLLHESFKHQRVRGEWFSLSEQDIESLKSPPWDNDLLFRVEDHRNPQKDR